MVWKAEPPLRVAADDSGTREISHGAVAAVPANAWTTIVSVTVADDRVVTAFGADLAALLGTRYRFRLRIDGEVKWSEVASTDAISYIPVPLDAPAGATIDVQLTHGEATATDCVASIAHRSRRP